MLSPALICVFWRVSDRREIKEAIHNTMKKIIMDLDETISRKMPGKDYSDALPKEDVIEKMRAFSNLGFTICIFTARNMRTYEGNIGKINANTLPVILQWLARNNVPYDEVIVGKPWCGHDGFYVDDRAIRPSEFVALSPEEITKLLAQES